MIPWFGHGADIQKDYWKGIKFVGVDVTVIFHTGTLSFFVCFCECIKGVVGE